MDYWFVEWQFSPKDFFENFFEDEFSETIENICLNFKMGIIEGMLGYIDYEQAEELLQKLHPHVERLFQVIQILDDSLYDLRYGMIFQKKPDSNRKIPVSAKFGPCEVSVKSDISVDRDGQTISCAMEERIIKKGLFQLANKHLDDLVLQSLLGSYDAAVHNPEDEFIHLYEIRDALKSKFKGKNKVCEKLNITTKDWDRLGELANKLPILQGRHRGQTSINELRSATQCELTEARKISRNLIKSYLDYLSK